MSEPTTETPATDAPEAQEQDAPPAEAPQDPTPSDASDEESPDSEAPWDPERAKAKIRKINSENKTLRERATQAEQQAAAVPDLKQQNTTLASENLRLQVGYELGLPLNLAVRLQGSTREELLSDAESLVELVAPTKAAPGRPSTQQPVEQLRPGASPVEVPPVGEADYPSHWFPKVQRGSQSGA